MAFNKYIYCLLYQQKGKGKSYSPDIPTRFRELYINNPQVSEHTLSQSHLSEDNAAQFATAVAIHSVPIFVQAGTHYCWMDRVGVDSQLAQSFET